MNDRLEILEFWGEEGSVSATKTGLSRLSVAGVVRSADSAHFATERPVCRDQMKLQEQKRYADPPSSRIDNN